MSALGDRYDVRRAVRASGLLLEFNAAGVLVAADVHVAQRLSELADVHDEEVTLAAALAVRAPRIGHVHVDLATVRETAVVDAEELVDLSALPWPEGEGWVARVAASPLTGESRPLRLEGTRLYLDRYWAEERQVAEDLLALSASPPPVDLPVLRAGLARLYGDEVEGRQALAAAAAVLNRLAVVAGGPGTGKTTTVARIVALLCEQAAEAGEPTPLVALAAPTGKAAARLEEAVHEEAAKLSVDAGVKDTLLDLRASTLHRLLGWRPDSTSRFRHNRRRRLPHDVVIVDETSMVSLSLMARLVEAIRPDARVVLVGDPGQLASIEAGAVLGDIVGPATQRLRMTRAARENLGEAIGATVDAADPPAGVTLGDGIVVLTRVRRFGEGIAKVAEAIRRGDADEVMAVLRDPPEDVRWVDADPGDRASEAALAVVRAGAVAAGRTVIEAARAGDAEVALAALGRYRILCAHRRGPHGVSMWTARVESWLAAEIPGFQANAPWYAGRPLLVMENDYDLGLYNGDTGVVVQQEDRIVAAFERSGEIVEYSPTRLTAVATAYAMTIHKSQGSQFDTASVILPPPDSRILTRELLYTAATRARKLLVLAGSEESLRAAVGRPIARASGLRRRLWAGDY